MKAKSLLVVLCISALMLFGFQALGPSRAFSLDAMVKIQPETVSLGREGTWITVYISLPGGYNVGDIDRTEIFLKDPLVPEWTVSQSWSNIAGDRLMVKFDSKVVIDHLWNRLCHMGLNRAQITLTVEGQLNDGTSFAGSDTLTAMDPSGLYCV